VTPDEYREAHGMDDDGIFDSPPQEPRVAAVSAMYRVAEWQLMEAVVESAGVFAEYHVCNTHETGPCELCKPVRALAAYRKEHAL